MGSSPGHKHCRMITAALTVMTVAFSGGLTAEARSTPVDPVSPHADAVYKFVFDLGSGKPAPDGTNPGLEEVARFHKLYETYGVPAANLKFVIVLHGDKTDISLAAPAYAARHAGAGNADVAALQALSRIGVRLVVASPALTQAGFTQADVLPGIEIGPLANVTFLDLEAQGYVYTGTRDLNAD